MQETWAPKPAPHQPNPVLCSRSDYRHPAGTAKPYSLEDVPALLEALQQGRRPKPYFAVGFAGVGQMLAVFTPKRWEVIARLREIGPVTTAQLARTLDRDDKRVAYVYRESAARA